MNKTETPLQKIYWERENIINRLLSDKRLKGQKRHILIEKALNLTYEMKLLEA